MVQNNNKNEFYFPYTLYLSHEIIEILSYFIFIIPLLLLLFLKIIFKLETNEFVLSISILIGLVLLLYFNVYKKINKDLSERLFLNYIKKNVPCPNCNSSLSYFKRDNIFSKLFHEYTFVCGTCLTENEIEVEEDAKGLRTKWILSKKRPLKMDSKEYKNIIENVKDEEKLATIMEKLDLKEKDIIKLNQEYNRKYTLPKLKKYDKKIRRFAYISLFIWVIVGLFVYYLYLNYGLLNVIDFKFIFAGLCLLYTITLIFYAWKIDKKT